MTSNDWLYFAGLLAYAIVEWWLGRTPQTRAASVIELVWLLVLKILRRETVIVDKQVKTAKELDDVLVLVLGVVRAAKAGKKPQEIASAEVGALIAAISGAENIPAEYAENPGVALATAGARLGELVAILIAPK